MAMYAEKHGGQFPPTIEILAASSDLTPTVFVCPSSNDQPPTSAPVNWTEAFRPEGQHLSYVYVAGGLTTSDVTPKMVLAYENPHNHLDEGMNVMFGDYRVQWVSKEEAERIAAERPSSKATTRPAK
jgi:hypothetical protein